jgi:hypothetical protein
MLETFTTWVPQIDGEKVMRSGNGVTILRVFGPFIVLGIAAEITDGLINRRFTADGSRRH